MQSRQKQGSFQTMWDDQETEEELESMRQRLVSAYQMAVFITILDVSSLSSLFFCTGALSRVRVMACHL